MTTWTVAKPFSDPHIQRRAEWVATMLTASEALADKLGITAEMVVGQAACESQWGEVKVGNWGLFGEKAGPHWKGKTATVTTREFIDGQYVVIDDVFRDFDSAQDCIDEHFSFLDSNPAYRAEGVFDKVGDEHFANALKAAGYATDPNYPSVLLAFRDTIFDYYIPHLSADGKDPPPAPPRVLHIGMSGKDVELLQSALKTQGFYVGEVDGQFGPHTYDAVTRAQALKNIAIDGVVGDETRKALGM